MPTVMKLLRGEIERLARKEARVLTKTLQSASAQYRRDIAALKREVRDMRRSVSALGRKATREIVPAVAHDASAKFRFVAKGFKTMRQRLGLSAAELGQLLEVSGLSIYKWEQGKARPRQRHLPRIAALRALGKREVQALLAKLPRKKA